MFAKTVCKPGSHICIVPIGLRTTLQYNANGVLEKVFSGYEEGKQNISEKLLSVVKKSKLVPTSIPTKGGTTWVYGVFYTDKSFDTPGILPSCIEPEIIDDITRNTEDYTFYAGKVESLAASFKSLLTVRNWISMSGFNSLPVYMIPAELNNEAFVKMVNTDRYSFRFPLISGYMIFEGNDFRYYPLGLVQYKVKSVTSDVDEQGYIKATVIDSDDDVHIYQYSEAAYKGIQKGSLIVCKRDGKLLYTNTAASAPKVVKVTCSSCGNTFICPESGPVCCTDSNCVSNIYPRISKFMSTLDLPILTYDKFKGYVSKKKLTCFTDTLILPEYKNIKIECTLAKFLQALVPAEICSDAAVFSKLASTCNNSVKTFVYYLTAPGRLRSDIGASTLMINRLISWISESENALMFTTLLDSGQITIKETDKKFDGAPIFRGKKIAITGKFRHGDCVEIISILKSYSGEVSIGIEGTADCLVIGDFRENIDGKSLQIARESGIPTFYESDFFAKYQIDDDITANLL